MKKIFIVLEDYEREIGRDRDRKTETKRDKERYNIFTRAGSKQRKELR